VFDVIITRVSRGTFPALAAIFLLALNYAYTAVGNTFISHSCRVWRFVELLNIKMPRSSKNPLVLMQLGTVRKDLTDFLACGIIKLS